MVQVWRQTKIRGAGKWLRRESEGSTYRTRGIGQIHASHTDEGHHVTSSNAPKWVPKASGSQHACVHCSTSCNSSSGISSTGHVADLMLQQRDSFTWTARISHHTKCGQSREALKIYQQMLEGGVKPNSYTFVAVLKACSILQDLESARQVHAKVVESGFQSDIYVETKLVDTYGKCGSLADARLVFEQMSDRDVVTWNAMIWGCVDVGCGEKALELYARMQQEGVKSDGRTFVGILKACSALTVLEEPHNHDEKDTRLVCLEQVRAIHSDIVKHGFKLTSFVGNMLVDVYAKCGSLEEAKYVFVNMPERDVVSWNAMISGFGQLGNNEDALELFTQMQQSPEVPDSRTFVSVMRACSMLVASEETSVVVGKCKKRWCLEQARAIHRKAVQGGFELDVYLGTMLVDVYSKCGNMMDARSVFEKLPQRDVVTWNAMILGYSLVEEGEEALKLYTRMLQEGVPPSDRTFLGALKACCSLPDIHEDVNGVAGRVKAGCLEQVRTIHSHVVKSRCPLGVHVGNMLIDVYAKCESLEDARTVFENMPHRDVVSWNTMLLGYVDLGRGDLALQLYDRMRQEGVVPDDRTMVAALKGCSLVAGLEKGNKIHAEILTSGNGTTSLYVQTALIDMYGKCGSMEAAQEVFDGLTARNIVSWSALISGYAKQGKSEVVFDLFDRMSSEGLQPNGTVFLSLLTACSHVGLLGRGQKYFEVMSKVHGIAPTVAHFTCLVDLLGRSGHLNKAMDVVRTMPCQADIALWQTLLSACRKWGNVELGRQAFEGALRLDKNDAAAYVLMSNIYAAADMAENACKVQAARLKTRTTKQLGLSWWTDVCGVAHAFGVGDREHPQILEISEQVQSLGLKMMEDACMSGST